jgi:hypothetical protein
MSAVLIGAVFIFTCTSILMYIYSYGQDVEDDNKFARFTYCSVLSCRRYGN